MNSSDETSLLDILEEKNILTFREIASELGVNVNLAKQRIGNDGKIISSFFRTTSYKAYPTWLWPLSWQECSQNLFWKYASLDLLYRKIFQDVAMIRAQ